MSNPKRLFDLLDEAREGGVLDEALKLVDQLNAEEGIDSDAFLDFDETSDELQKILARELRDMYD